MKHLETEELLRTRYADAEKVRLVCDNLNTHTQALSRSIRGKNGRKLMRLIDFHNTPKHSSYLNIAKIKLSSMPQQAILRHRNISEG